MKRGCLIFGWFFMVFAASAQNDSIVIKNTNTATKWLDSLKQTLSDKKERKEFKSAADIVDNLKISVIATYFPKDAELAINLIDALKIEIVDMIDSKDSSNLFKELNAFKEQISKLVTLQDAEKVKGSLKEVTQALKSVRLGKDSAEANASLEAIRLGLNALKSAQEAKALLPHVDKLLLLADNLSLVNEVNSLMPKIEEIRKALPKNEDANPVIANPVIVQQVGDTDKSPVQIAYTCKEKELYITIDSTTKYFNIGIANAAFKTLGSKRKFLKDYADEDIDDFLKTRLSDDCYATKKALLLKKIRDYINGLIQAEIRSEAQSIVDSLTAELNKDVVAGQFHSLGKEIPVKVDTSERSAKPSRELAQSQFAINTSIDALATTNFKAVPKLDTSDTISDRITNVRFSVDKISIKTDYNRISRVTIVGILLYQKGKDAISKQMTVSNDLYSLSLVGLNKRYYTVILPKIEHGVKFEINYADVINYEPYEGVLTYVVANQEVNLPIGGYAKIFRRRLSEFTSFRTLLDPLGFLGNSPNGFAQLEGDAIVPMGRMNWKSWNRWPQATFNFSYIYSNTINNERRIAPVYSLRNNNQPTITNPLALNSDDTSRFLNNIDYIRYSYYHVKAHLSVVAWERKRFNSWLHLELGFIALGSRVDTSEAKTKTVHKFIPEARVRLEIRPELPIGASVSGGLAWLGNGHIGNNTPTNINDISFLYKSKWAIPHEVMVYAVSGSGSGGLFFKYSGWIGFHRRLADGVYPKNFPINVGIRKTSYFPQVLLGYSTNLGALVKKETNTRSNP